MGVGLASRQGASTWLSPWWIASAAMHSAVVVGLGGGWDLPSSTPEETPPPILLSLVAPTGADERGETQASQNEAGAVDSRGEAEKEKSNEAAEPSVCEKEGRHPQRSENSARSGPTRTKREQRKGERKLSRTARSAEKSVASKLTGSPHPDATRAKDQIRAAHKSRADRPASRARRSTSPTEDLETLSSTLTTLHDDSHATMRVLARVASPKPSRVHRAERRSTIRSKAKTTQITQEQAHHSQPRLAPVVERWASARPMALQNKSRPRSRTALRQPTVPQTTQSNQPALKRAQPKLSLGRAGHDNGQVGGDENKSSGSPGTTMAASPAAGTAVRAKEGDGDEDRERAMSLNLLPNTITLDAGLMQDHPYWRKVYHRIQPLWDFPMRAMILGRQGVVLVSFRVEPLTGEVQELRVQRSSGIPSFDENVVAAVEQASPFGPMPEDTPGRGARVNAPFRFHNHTLR